MAILYLDKTWITNVATGDTVSGTRDSDDGDEFSVAARVQSYAGGRQRGITTEGVSGSWAPKLRGVTWADTEKLKAWLGQTVLIRDNRGRKMFGLISRLPRATWKEQLDLYDVEVAVQLVTVNESV